MMGEFEHENCVDCKCEQTGKPPHDTFYNECFYCEKLKKAREVKPKEKNNFIFNPLIAR